MYNYYYIPAIFCRSATLPFPSGKGVSVLLRHMMSSAVTTVEATDWSVSLRMDTPTLQCKEPLVQAVVASCAGNLQWTDPSATNTTSSVRYTSHYISYNTPHACTCIYMHTTCIFNVLSCILSKCAFTQCTLYVHVHVCM